MKNKKRWALIILLAGVLLLTTIIPVAAKISNSDVTGYCWFLPFSYDSDDWATGQNGYHTRNDYAKMECEFSDDRLDGFMLSEMDWDGKNYWDPFWYFTGINHGTLWLSNADGDLLWEGQSHLIISPIWVFRGKTVLHGRGVYEGLKAMLDVWGDFTQDPGIFFAGTIIDPGN